MRTAAATAVVAVAVAIVLASCGTPNSTRSLVANEYWLPADPGLVLGPGATAMACAGVGLDAVLTGSPSDPRKVWLVDATSAGRIDLVWPTGYSARFGQGFDVLNASGTIAIVGGSHVSGACVTAGDNVYWLPLE
jgi:hypothetical protein